MPTQEAVEAWKKQNKVALEVRTPYNLDFMNRRDDRKVGKNKDSIVENVRLVVTSDTPFEAEDGGMDGSALVNPEQSHMDQENAKQIMLGIDPDEE